ncbi:SAV_2336 N-terminal domain-related protein [Actinomadura terrae]|uniref:SAV_2336 N-terminal domain-related protein n=1 Tax=Actinomadura terrae TaxID=604353 RepID=UPI001FA70377|nr:SAV_2336 N-terminal domain-related protein [Actinomadura terrae]
MTSDLDRFRDVLAAVGLRPDAQELSEILWLACHLSLSDEKPEPSPTAPAPPPAPPVEPFADLPAPLTAPDAPPPRTALHPRPAAAAEPGGTTATEILVPTAPMLADPRGVQRALRPLKRRVPSRHRLELDEEATAARIADTGRWTPVLVPAPERWLTLSLVVDGGPSMRLWRPLARELAEVLVRQGSFQDVHVGHLDTTGRVSSAPGAPRRDPATLLDPSGRHAVLVLSDCSGPHWWDGRAARAVRRWARAGPTAIVQPLSERLWRRTAAPVTPGLAVLPRPGAPNTDLLFTPYDGGVAAGVPVPVLEVAPHWFAAWARLVSGAGPQPAAIATLSSHPPGGAPVRRERELPVGERVHRFLAAASPAAAELATHVAVSVPSLPVMRLIQHRVLGGSGPGQLAEVLLSGLLRPVGGVHYEFVPGAREALLDTLPRPEALHTRDVLEAVSAEIERLAGTSAETFRALLPRDGGPLTLTTDTDHFALVTPQTRDVLTPDPEMFETAPGNPRPFGHEFDPLSPSAQMPHGLVVGETEARQRVVREIVTQLVLHYSPTDLGIVFAGFGEHPLGAPIDLPHRRHAYEELLGTPNRMRRFLAFLEDEMRTRAATRPSRRLLVIADVSLTFPSSRRDAADALLSLAQRGEPLGVHLLLSSTTVEHTTIWHRFLPLLKWRIAATRLTPAELQQVMGRASLPFPSDNTAYLLTPGIPPRRIEVEEGLIETIRSPELEQPPYQGVPPPFKTTLIPIVARLDARETRLSSPPHAIFEGPFAPDCEAAAAAYGKALADSDVISADRMMSTSWTVLKGWLSGAPANSPSRWPGMLLIRDANPMASAADSRLVDVLAEQMDENDDLVVVLCGGPGLRRALSEHHPRFTRRFAAIQAEATFAQASGGPADMTELPPVTGRRLPLGIEHGDADEPVVLDLDVHPHLLVAGPPGTGKTIVMRLVLGELMKRLPADDKPVYFIDRTLDQRESMGGSDQYLRHAQTQAEATALLDEVAGRVRNRGPSRTADTYLVIAGRDGRLHDDLTSAVLPLLERSHQTGFHLVMFDHQATSGAHEEPLLKKLRELAAPAVLTGDCTGWEAAAWGVPSLAEALPRGWAVVARPGDRPKIVQLVT